METLQLTQYDFYEKLKASKTFSLDLETTGFDPKTNRIVGFALATNEGGWFIRVKGDNALPFLVVCDFIRELLSDPEKTVVFWNAKFDVSFLKYSNIEIKAKVADAMIASWLLKEDGRHGLKETAEREFGVKLARYEDVTGLFEVLDFDKYAEDDAKYTLRLWNRYVPLLEQEGLSKVFWDLQMRIVPIIMQMELDGVCVDLQYMAGYKVKLEKRQIELEEACYKLAGKKFLLTSPKQVEHILYTHLQIPTTGVKRNKTGLSTDAETIDRLADKGWEIAKVLLGHRGVTKLLTTYIYPWITRLSEDVDQRIYPRYHMTTTVTGRLSSSDPNFQNLPTDKDSIRKAIVPAKGRIFIDADFSQLELRIMAHMSKDPVMIDAFNNGKDIHKVTSELIGCERSIAKALNFGLLYGAGSNKFSRMAKISEDEAKLFIEKFFKTYVNIKDFHKWIENRVNVVGYVQTITGRRRRFPLEMLPLLDWKAKSEMYREAINFPIQGTASDIINISMRNFGDELILRRQTDPIWNDTRFVGQIHDELLLECPVELAETVKQLLVDKMRESVKLRVPLEVGVKIGYSWEETK